MSVAPSPSSARGEIVLQPAYFSSSAFVHPARTDIDSLIHEFTQQYICSPARPFALFKRIWQTQGWTWIQFRVLDTRSRAVFLSVVMRLFSERMGAKQPPLGRAAALFGLYTMFCTQPSSSAPPLSSTAQVQITCDLYQEVLALPDALDGEFLRPIRPHVVYLLSGLLRVRAFHILPHSEMHPLVPRALPREVVVEYNEPATSAAEECKRKGRPSRRERVKKARETLVALDRRCEDGGAAGPPPPRETHSRYASEKSALLGMIGEDERWAARLRAAEAAVGERMERIGMNK